MLTFPLAGPVTSYPASQVGILGPGSSFLREPAVLSEASKLMTEVWHWDPAFLRDAIGTMCLGATLPDRDGTIRYEPGRVPDSRQLTVAQFFDDVTNPDGPRWCLQQVSVEREIPVLAGRLDYPSCVPRDLINAVNMWLAAPSTVTPLHYDDTHNLFAQISGSKTFYLFPPESLGALYPGPLNTGAQHVSSVDLFHPDLARHPLAVSLSYRKVTVHAGEALLLPAFWWHQVVSGGVSVSLNYWWRAYVMDCLCPGFMRQLQSTAVQQDLRALTNTFDLGQENTDDAMTGASELARLLRDIGEHQAAVAVSFSILRTLQRQEASTGDASALLHKYDWVARSNLRKEILSTAEIAHLVDEVSMIISERIIPS